MLAGARAVQRARTAAFLRLLEAQLRRYGGRLGASVDPTAQIDGAIELRLVGVGEGPPELELELGPGASLGRNIGIELSRGRSALRLRSQTRVSSGVRFSLESGEINLGPRMRVRENSAFHVMGRVDAGERVLIGFGCEIHCAERVELHDRCALAHASTVNDHDHAVDGGDEWWALQPLAVEPVVVGSNTVVTAGARILRGVRLGRNSVVGANAVVLAGDYPDSSLLVGAPARVAKSLA